MKNTLRILKNTTFATREICNVIITYFYFRQVVFSWRILVMFLFVSSGSSVFALNTITPNNPMKKHLIASKEVVCDNEGVFLITKDLVDVKWPVGIEYGKVFFPKESRYYRVKGVNALGEFVIDSVYIHVNKRLSVRVMSFDREVCRGETVSMYASGTGGGVYRWSNGLGSNYMIQVTPKESDYFRVNAIDIFGCKSTDSVYIEVKDLPEIKIVSSRKEVCKGESVVLEAKGDAPYRWLDEVVSGEAFIPMKSTTYVLYGLGKNGCVSTDSFSLKVQEPKISIGNDTAICADQSIVLKGPNDFDSYEWSTGDVGKDIEVNESGVYSLHVKKKGSCDAADIVSVTVVDCEDGHDDLVVYPNPTSERLFIESKMLIRSATIYTTTGVQIHKERINGMQSQIDVSRYNSGSYLLRVRYESGVIVTRTFNKK